MATQYFYLTLKPTKSALPYIISKAFQISYDDSRDLATKQKDQEIKFRNHNNNPDYYNSEWSKGYFDSESANNDRTSIINSLRNSGNVVKTPDWP